MDSSKGPNRVNRAHWPTKENRHFYYTFMFFSVNGKMTWDGTEWGQEDFLLLIQTLPTFWAERIWILIICIFSEPQNSGFPGPQISEFQDSRFPDFQTPPAPPDQPSDPNLTPLPTHPGIKYVARALAAIMHSSGFMKDIMPMAKWHARLPQDIVKS